MYWGVVLFLFRSGQGTVDIRIAVLDLGLEKVFGYMKVAFFVCECREQRALKTLECLDFARSVSVGSSAPGIGYDRGYRGNQSDESHDYLWLFHEDHQIISVVVTSVYNSFGSKRLHT